MTKSSIKSRKQPALYAHRIVSNRALAAVLACGISTLPSFAAASNDESEMQQGMSSYKEHAYPEALGHFGAALPADFNNANLHYHMANCLVHLRQKESAIREYRIAYALEPHSKVGRYSKQCLYLFNIDADGFLPFPEAPAKVEKADEKEKKDSKESKKDALANVAKFVSEEDKTKQNLLDLMQQKARPGSAKLQQIGTNIFVRNYKEPGKGESKTPNNSSPGAPAKPTSRSLFYFSSGTL
ncbi:MAG TPA: hypothetical protein V6C76_14145 [Drouetiella sp.]